MKEKRSAKRNDRRESVSIQIVSSSIQGKEPPKVVKSETLDVSATGVKLYVNQHLEDNHILDFCVEFKNNPKRFLLTGETMWCAQKENSNIYNVGIKILDAQGTDYGEWQAIFERDTEALSESY